MIEQLVTYRRLVTLNDGTRVLIRPLIAADKPLFLDLFDQAPREDLEYFHSDAADPGMVARWCDELDYASVFPMVAVVGDKLVGDATLHIGVSYQRHIGWLRVYLDRAFRRRGIGGLMLSGLIDIARKMGLQQLVAEVPAHQVQVIKAFQNLGFKQEFTFNDFFMTPQGETIDVAVMILHLVEYPAAF
ncbi:MAG: GNAT family N-acetyltransferase [Thermoflexales bacterium]|nr:GNAT family N-acetyltransferase [Thermoflexales bacterium]